MESENCIERIFVRKLSDRGCIVFKFVSPGHAGVPDRIVISPKGRIYFVELKRPNGKLRKLQEWTRKRMLGNHCPVYIVKCREDIEAFSKFIDMMEDGNV